MVRNTGTLEEIAKIDANSPRPEQKLSSNSSVSPYEGGIGKAYVMFQPRGETYDLAEGHKAGTIFKDLDDKYQIE
ncbi:MAG: spore coat associated protein CotJA [Clostridiaceae bacterium]